MDKPLPDQEAALLKRLLARTVTVNDCQLWTGPLTPAGVAVVSVSGTAKLAHRVVYELLCLLLRRGDYISQTCGNRPCLAADHLAIRVTRMCRRGHQLTRDRRSTGNRALCRTCRRDSARAYARRQAALRRAAQEPENAAGGQRRLRRPPTGRPTEPGPEEERMEPTSTHQPSVQPPQADAEVMPGAHHQSAAAADLMAGAAVLGQRSADEQLPDRRTALTDGDVSVIRNRFAAEPVTQQQLADDYGVDRQAIYKAIKGRHFFNAGGPIPPPPGMTYDALLSHAAEEIGREGQPRQSGCLDFRAHESGRRYRYDIELRGRRYVAARLSYEHALGAIPPGHDVVHQCPVCLSGGDPDEPCRHWHCVNPECLLTVDSATAMRINTRRPMYHLARKCKRGHPTVNSEGMPLPRSRGAEGQCRLCNNQKAAARSSRRRQERKEREVAEDLAAVKALGLTQAEQNLLRRAGIRPVLIEITPDGHWLWKGHVSRNGYGYFKSVLVHRVIVQADREEIPDGFWIDHLCRVRHCLRPGHLEAVPPGVNTARGQSPAARVRRTGRCKRGKHPMAGPGSRVRPVRKQGRVIGRTCGRCAIDRRRERELGRRAWESPEAWQERRRHDVDATRR